VSFFGGTDRSRPEVVTLGETMALLTAPRVGPLRHAASLDLSCAGAESNLAIGLTRLGHRVAWIGRIGADEFGALVRRTLAAEGVTANAIVDNAAPTGLMVKSHRTDAHTEVIYYRSGSAGSRLSPDDVDAELIASARVLHVTGITPALSGSAREAVRYAIGVARQAGVPVSLDLNYRRALWSPEHAAAEYMSLIRLADIVFAGEAEARMVTMGDTPEDLGLALAAMGPGQVLIKRGQHGAVGVFAKEVVSSKDDGQMVSGEVLVAPAYPVSAVDSVGAGDAFAAGYLSALLDGREPAKRMARASLAGAFAVTVPGDWEGLPSRTDLDLLRADRMDDPVLR
jgi:2-dehydro-3-deoxygluconokinase